MMGLPLPFFWLLAFAFYLRLFFWLLASGFDLSGTRGAGARVARVAWVGRRR
jgi:hypothetical protein